jgi:hypothetical protein
MRHLFPCWIISIGLVTVLLWPSVSASAVAQPSLKMQIVAPECTLDTINDGLGPVQVITCPVGTIDPDGGTDFGGANSGGSINGGNNGGSTNIQVSRRLQSPADDLVLLELLQNSGMTIEIPGVDALSLPHSDVISKSDNMNSSVVQNSLVLLAVAVGVVIILVGFLHINGGLQNLLSRSVKGGKKK